jgi:hypothetical protein
MKKIFIGILAIGLLGACKGTTTATTAATGAAVTAENAAKLKFDNDAFDFGKIKQGDKVTHEYKFVNEGKSPLIISDSYATCGCTKPEWPKTPIKPGDSGVIKVTFSSAGKSGLQDKQITIVANTLPTTTVVHLVGEVLESTKK